METGTKVPLALNRLLSSETYNMREDVKGPFDPRKHYLLQHNQKDTYSPVPKSLPKPVISRALGYIVGKIQVRILDEVKTTIEREKIVKVVPRSLQEIIPTTGFLNLLPSSKDGDELDDNGFWSEEQVPRRGGRRFEVVKLLEAGDARVHGSELWVFSVGWNKLTWEHK